MHGLFVAAVALLCVTGAATAESEPALHDPMESIGLWPVDASDSVKAQSDAAADGRGGKAVRLSYDFGNVSGYAFIRRNVALTLPQNFEVRFRIRGSGLRNDLQMKLTSGDSVWWQSWSDYRAPATWTEMRIPASAITFAWGPNPKAALTDIDGIEFVVARNRDGGAGAIEIDDLRLVAIPGPRLANYTIDVSDNDRLSALAKAAPRGEFPRAFIGEQPYWTLAGSDGGAVAALISEDGSIEPAKGSYSIEPAIVAAGKRYRWSDVRAKQSLADGYLPIPTVVWEADNWRLETTLLADSAGHGVQAGYRLTNIGKMVRKLTLELGIQPWQVNPPAQFLSQRGGFSPVRHIERTANGLSVIQPQGEGDPSKRRYIRFAKVPDRIVKFPLAGWAGDDAEAATLAWHVTLAPGQSQFISLAFSDDDIPAPDWPHAYSDTFAHWQATLNRVKIAVPADKQAIADTMRTALAHILMSRVGPMLKPGTRSYDRAWIRDGAMMSEGLLRMGRSDVAREFASWYGQHLFPNGKVPCCVDFRGADPVPENDSHGQYIFLLAELYRYTGDRALLEGDWPKLLAAWQYMDQLRLSERTAINQSPERQIYYGLMPPSISHEGYSSKPQYSLWDDFWALRGYKDAADIAAWLGKAEAATMASSRDQFATDLHAAILATRDHYGINYIPGATSLGDFDATSTTIALDPGGEMSLLDPAMLNATFERYWREFVTRRDGTRKWDDYTPYELRTMSSFVRLGWRDRAQNLLAYFLADQRPAGWNGWAEVVGRDVREIRFIGDMPHAWIASDYLRGALDMFAFEDIQTKRLVLGGGLTADWLAGSGSQITGLATPYGSLDLTINGNARKMILKIAGSAQPPGGYSFPWPFETRPPAARINGKKIKWNGKMLLIPQSRKPIKVEIG